MPISYEHLYLWTLHSFRCDYVVLGKEDEQMP
jgi:hypothetical protein